MRERIGGMELDLSDVDKWCNFRCGGPNNYAMNAGYI